MKGKRAPDDTEPHLLRAGEYATCHGRWIACTPTGLLGSLRKHTVREESDGTITVDEPIRCTAGGNVLWLGYLKLGNWITC